ncbi:hypothetical protein HMPREF7215_0091 [Pyramidobacter piscolens W5455]|uniref:Transposase DDE domain-containing protein n=1 Tax=Pyramidobacter piscolens W5455 TaxID=352165 RepID=A0ABM9ZUS3_9BACT|nr:hypothetical protein HMPREF7215_0091 [Pyramidobacter piscolens W5455]
MQRICLILTGIKASFIRRRVYGKSFATKFYFALQKLLSHIDAIEHVS